MAQPTGQRNHGCKKCFPSGKIFKKAWQTAPAGVGTIKTACRQQTTTADTQRRHFFSSVKEEGAPWGEGEMTLFENMGVAVVSRSQGCTGSLPHSPGPKASTIASWTDQMRGQGLHDTIGGFVPLFQRPLHHSTILSLLSCFVQKVSTPLVVKKKFLHLACPSAQVCARPPSSYSGGIRGGHRSQPSFFLQLRQALAFKKDKKSTLVALETVCKLAVQFTWKSGFVPPFLLLHSASKDTGSSENWSKASQNKKPNKQGPRPRNAASMLVALSKAGPSQPRRGQM